MSERRQATIDSGAEAGCSIWYPGGQLDWCGLVTTDDLYAWQVRCLDYDFTKVTVELPIYRARQGSKVSPNDLIKLGFSGGRIIPAFCHPVYVDTIWPNSWKGELPDQILYERILGALTAEELALIPKLAKSKIHNVLDSIGIGLHLFGRMPRTMAT